MDEEGCGCIVMVLAFIGMGTIIAGLIWVVSHLHWA
jgi:hypothetical protein